MNLIQNGNLAGGYGKEVSNEMKDIMKKYMIEDVSKIIIYMAFQEKMGLQSTLIGLIDLTKAKKFLCYKSK